MTQPRALTRLVILDGEVWEAGSVPPPAVAERIRNPKCWEPVEDDLSPWAPPAPAPAVTEQAEPAGQPGDDTTTADPGDLPSAGQPDTTRDDPELHDRLEVGTPAPLPAEPPRSGRAASKEAWREFATSRGVEVPDGADRTAIITACRKAGVIQ